MLLIYLGAGAAVLAMLLTPVTKVLARRLGAMDMPGPAKVHGKPMPRLGGMAIWATVLLIATPAVWLLSQGGNDGLGRTLPILLAGFACAVMGAVDDCRSLSARFRAAAQVIVAGGLVTAGVRVEALAPAAGALLSWAWLMGILNAVNLLDGLDGLAAGTCALASISLAAIGWAQGGVQEAVLGACVAGSCLGFLAHNRPPASVFMGDNGSLFLGCVLGGLVLSLAGEPDGLPVSVGGVLCLGLPVMDVFLVMVRRVRQRKRVFGPDRGHFYDQLMRRGGLSQRQTVAVAYGLTAALGVIGFFTAQGSLPVALTIAGGLFIIPVMLFAWLAGMLFYEG